MRPSGPHLLGPWRRAFQWGITLALLLVPFVRMNGRSLLRLDVSTLSLHAFGQVFRIEELYLFLLFGLALILLFLIVTLVLGRAWCGWACPQTSLTDLAEGFARLIGVKVSAGRMQARPWQKALLQVFYLGAALLFAASLVWYFISPYDFFPRLLDGTLGAGALGTIAVVAGAVYLDLALVRRLMCREFCPYGRFQTALVDPGTLTLRFHPDEAKRCIRCGACTRACPTGIDIRRGFQVECINCGRCLDACREVMARLGQPGIIRYTFGHQGKGPRALLNPRLLLVALVFVALSAGLVIAVVGRPQASLKLRSGEAASRLLEDGKQATFFTGFVTNRLLGEQVLSLVASTEGGAPLEVRGPVAEVVMAGGAKQPFKFALVTPALPPGQTLTVIFTLSNGRGENLVRERAFITAARD